MFYKPAVDDKTFPILEVGPGALPFPFSDIWLDMKFDEKEQLAQSGHSMPASGKPMVYYDGKKFPFKDKAFRYVIASHVLEHVPWDSLFLFLSELQRVAHAGYIELPRWAYELINNIPEHISTGDVRDGVLHVYKKNGDHDYNFFTTLLMEKSRYFREYIEKEKDLYFCRIEWEQTIPFELHENGYAITEGKDAIKKLLVDDCERLVFSGNTAVSLAIYEAQKISESFLRKVRAFFQRKTGLALQYSDREAISVDRMRSFLLCPVSGHELSRDFRCDGCGFSYSRKGNEYYPRVVKK